MVGLAYGGTAVGLGALSIVTGAAVLIGVGAIIGAAAASKPSSSSYTPVSSTAPFVLINGRLYRLTA